MTTSVLLCRYPSIFLYFVLFDTDPVLLVTVRANYPERISKLMYAFYKLKKCLFNRLLHAAKTILLNGRGLQLEKRRVKKFLACFVLNLYP